VRTLVAAGTRFADRVNSSLPLRVWNRLSQVRGTVLVQGIAYSAFFSVFPILALTFVGFGLVLQSRPVLRERLTADLTSYLDENIPGLVRTVDNPGGLVDPAGLVGVVSSGGLLTPTAVVAVVTLAWAALGWVGALRLGIRAAMHLPVSDFHPVWAKIRDLMVGVLIGGAAVVSAVVSVGVTTATGRVVAALAVPEGTAGRFVVLAVSFVVVAVLDTLLFLLQYQVLAASPLPRRYVLRAAVGAALAFGVLKQLSGALLGSVGSAGATSVIAVAGSVLAVVALLIWMNVVARITLLAAAWAGLTAEEAVARAAVPVEVPAEPPPDPDPGLDGGGTGPSGRAEDRVVLAAGVILGATAAVGIRAVGSAVAVTGRVLAGAVAGGRAGDEDDDRRG
jgi:membrane protein